MATFTRALQQAARRRRLASGPSWDAASEALFARMTSAPDATRKGLIDDFIVALKAEGLWTKIEGLWVMAAHDSQAARLNWISTSFGLTPVNSPTFTADRGYAGNGSSSYLDTGFTPSSSSVFLQNSAAIGCWVNTETAGGSSRAMGCETGGARIHLNTRASGAAGARARLNVSTEFTWATAPDSRLGMSIVSRTGASAQALYRQGSKVADDTTTSSGRPSHSMFLLAANDDGTPVNYSTSRLAMAFVSSGMNDTEAGAFEAAIEAFLTAVGGN